MPRLRFGLVVIVILLPVLFLLSTCGKDSPTKSVEPEPPIPPPPPTPVATRIEVTPLSATLNAIGQTVQLTARVLDQNNNAMAGASISWTSSAVGIATVSSAGLVTAVANGAAVITATSGNVSATVNVTVSQTAGSIVIEPDMVTLMSIGQTIQLTSIVRDGSGQPVADAAVTWQSSDESVATVSTQGLVTAVKYGTTVITARSGDAFIRINVMVIQSVRSITIEPREATLTYIGASVQLAVTVLDQNEQPVENAMVTWQSSDESVATVNAQGLVTAVMGGDARITAQLGDLEDSIWIAVEILAPRTTRDVLELFYYSMGGSDWNNNTNWLSEKPLEDWYGVTVISEQRVIGLFLDNNGLKGTLPVEFALLTHLSALSLKGNELTGEIPRELGLLPNLNELDLSQNNLIGSIPGELGNLGKLYVLNLSQNNLTGNIPAELGQLSLFSNYSTEPLHRSQFNLEYNQLTGPIPPELGNLVNVLFFSLSHNGLTGSIPAELGQFTSVTTLDLSGNQLTGGIPPEFGNLAELRTLRLDDNPSLSGPLPLEMIELEHLMFLRLGRTQLCIPSVLVAWAGAIETVESSICAMESSDRDVLIALYHAAGGGNWSDSNNWLSSQPLSKWFGVSTDADGRVDQLSLESNNLAGTITPALARLAALTSLDLGGNPSLAGRLPLELADLPIERIRVAGSAVCAPADVAFQAWLMQVSDGSEIASCGQFVQLDRDVLIELYHATDGPNWNYSMNWLTDQSVENWIGVTTDRTGRVISLNLNSAGLKGMIPAGLERLTRLEKLALENSELTGTIPPEIGNLRNLTEIRLWGNQLTGEIPPEIGQLKNLAILDLRFNQLTGNIPSEIGQLNSLRSLQAQRNQLSGNIPPEIGQLQNLTILELNDNRLTGDIPPEIGKLNNLSELHISGNQLVGEIPSETGQLGSLRVLAISDNQLTGAIPPEIGQLGNLTSLLLAGNQLSGEIPPEIGNMNKLQNLWLRINQFSGGIPREIAQLANLNDLLLDTNLLSGEIPPEIGELSALENLWLSKNQLTGKIPPEIGQLGNLIQLILSDNQLSGNIPPEIGKMNALWLLHLENNHLSGEIPPELGEMDQLYELKLSNNENMSGPIPIEMTNIASMRTLFLEGTRICAPDHAIYEAWLGNLEVVNVVRCRRSTGSMVYLTQATQTFDDFRVPLIAGEDALLRVFVIADEQVDASMPPVRATFYQDGAEIHRVEIAGGATNIPSAIDESSLSSSSNEIIPGSVIMPGLELVVEIDPEGTLDSSSGVQSRIPEMGRMPINVRNVPGLDLTVVPLLWSEDPDHGVVAETEGLTTEDDLLRATRYLLPVRDTDFKLTVREPVFTSVEPVFFNHGRLIREVETIRVLDGAYGYYMGVLQGWGGAVAPGRRGFVASLHEPVIAHEIGHQMGLYHAPCGTVGDPDYPYSDGSVGAWGYDILENKLVSPDTPDVMSFCLDDFWISDYHFRRALVYRIRGEPTGLVSSSTASTRVMLLWGGIDERNELVIEPSFVVDAPPYLPGEDGPYQLAGYDGDGNTLFTLNFDMGEIVDGEGGGSFAYTIPIASGWSDRLSRITLSGPEGDAELTRYGDRSTALLRDQFTGEVRGFMRDSTGSDITLQHARRVVPESGLDVVISPGIPDSADW